MSTTGKTEEKKWEEAVTEAKGFVYRFEDLYDAAKKGKAAGRQPSDFITTLNGVTFFAEIKTTTKNLFSFSGIQPNQWRTAVKQTKAGGLYYFIIYFSKHALWCAIPASVLIKSEKQSINVTEAQHYVFDIENVSESFPINS